MRLDQQRLQQFETGLDPLNPLASEIPCKILGYGEISTVIEVDNDATLAAKRMPLFDSDTAAEKYAENYRNYCSCLRDAGLNVPEDTTIAVKGHQNTTVLYILQKQLPPARFGHQLIHTESAEFINEMARQIVGEIEKVWAYNATYAPDVQLAVDGQLSNWVLLKSGELLFIDTSTPLMHLQGREVLDPELLLQSAPSFLRWLIRWQFLDDVMTRYYDRRQVFTDLIANLYKEQRPDLVDPWIGIINRETAGLEPLNKKQIESYYREDKLIWRLFLGLRRLDRLIKTNILSQRYVFILPGKIKR